MCTSGVPNWVFHATIIAKALEILDQQLAELPKSQQSTFYTTEAHIALEESKASLAALQDILHSLDTASTHASVLEIKTA